MVRVLVVDDCPDNRSSMAFSAFHPQAVVLDIGLPWLDGWQVARRIREQEGGSAVLLIALTGHGREEDRQRSREAGIDLHLVKPADPQELERLLAGAVLTPAEPL